MHTRLDAVVARFLPDIASLGRYHRTIVRPSTGADIVFRSAADVAPFTMTCCAPPSAP